MESGTIKATIRTGVTIVWNDLIRSKTLTLEEKGLLVYLLSHSGNYTILKKNLPSLLNEKEGTIDRVFKSLQNLGYIISKRVQNKEGVFVGWSHEVFDEPKVSPECDSSDGDVLPTPIKPDIGKTRGISKPIVSKKNNSKEEYGEPSVFAATATTHTPSDVEASTPEDESILTDENQSKNTEVNQSAGEETFFPRSQTPLKKEGVSAAQSLSTLQSDEQRFERFKKLVRNYFKDHACEDEPKVFKGTWALTPKQYVKLIEDYNVNVFQERMEVIKKIILEIQNWKGSKSSANLTIRNWVNRDLRVSSHTMLPATKAEPKLPPPPSAATTLPQEIQFETFEEQTARKRREREEKLNQSNKQNNENPSNS